MLTINNRWIYQTLDLVALVSGIVLSVYLVHTFDIDGVGAFFTGLICPIGAGSVIGGIFRRLQMVL